MRETLVEQAEAHVIVALLLWLLLHTRCNCMNSHPNPDSNSSNLSSETTKMRDQRSRNRAWPMSTWHIFYTSMCSIDTKPYGDSWLNVDRTLKKKRKRYYAYLLLFLLGSLCDSSGTTGRGCSTHGNGTAASWSVELISHLRKSPVWLFAYLKMGTHLEEEKTVINGLSQVLVRKLPSDCLFISDVEPQTRQHTDDSNGDPTPNIV